MEFSVKSSQRHSSDGRDSCQGANSAHENAVCDLLKILPAAEVPKYDEVTKDVLYAVMVLLSLQADDVESIDSTNNSQHEFWVPICCFTF
jgi:hypothetical protein